MNYGGKCSNLAKLIITQRDDILSYSVDSWECSEMVANDPINVPSGNLNQSSFYCGYGKRNNYGR